jgi:CRISPR system Cascade subunit CasC
MHEPLFIQLHTLVSYPAALLNRDDAGFAKRMPFGGATRTRISSQCLKYHWRKFQGRQGFASLRAGGESVDMTIRSRHTFERYLVAPLVADGVAPDLAVAATQAIMAAVLGESARAKRTREDAAISDSNGPKSKTKAAKSERKEPDPKALVTSQLTAFGKPEIDFLLAEARALAAEAGSVDEIEPAQKRRFTRDWRKNLDALHRGAGLDAALFGRMVTSDKLARCDAAVHVAHAFTVHPEQTEIDYFTAVDDLSALGQNTERLGSAHVNTTELTSGLFYVYVVIDVAQLVSNLEGCDPDDWKAADRQLARDVTASLVQIVSSVSPGAKKGSTAPYAYAHLTLVECGSSQPRTLANAFLKPVPDHPDLLANAYQALADYVTDVDQVYGFANRRALAAVGPKERLSTLASPTTVEAVARFAASEVAGRV